MTRLVQAILNWCRHCKDIKFNLRHAAKQVSEIDPFEEAQPWPHWCAIDDRRRLVGEGR